MGIVIRQSIQNVLITCIGFGLGAINTLFLFTRYMDKSYYGLVMYLLASANLLWPLISFGVQNTIIKFYSSYKDEKEQQRFISVIIAIPIAAGLLLLSLGSLFYTQILDYFSTRHSLAKDYFPIIFVLGFAFAYFEVFFSLAKVKLKSVLGNILKEVFIRFVITVLLILIYLNQITTDQFIYMLVLAYMLRVLLMIAISMRYYSFRMPFSLPVNFKEICTYSLIIVLAGSVAAFLIDIDKTMIEYYLPISSVASYGICAYIASVIILPSRAMHQIIYPLTASFINEKKAIALKDLFYKSTTSLLIISGFIFILIISNVNELFQLIPSDYELLIWVIIFLGTAKISDCLLGNSNAIVYSSDFYKIILYAGSGITCLALLLNIVLIPKFGLVGAASATTCSVFAYNIIKSILIYRTYQIHPINLKNLMVLLLIVLFCLSFYFWEFPFDPIINIFSKSALIVISYGFVIIKLKLSKEINETLLKYFSMLSRLLKKSG